MTSDQIAKANAELRDKSPLEIVRWAVAQAKGRAIVSTNFRPYEAVFFILRAGATGHSGACGWTTATTARRLTSTPRS